ncbi:MAG: transcriptional repressor [Phycisphaerales bacterium]|nr:transcriptional repressor [Phycisphaerales bacterium]
MFRRHLKSLGQKYTPERAQILDVLVRLDDLFEADHLLAEMRRGGFRVSKATVYRTIKLLKDAGIIQQVLLDTDTEQAHYQLVYGRRSRDLIIRTDTRQAIPVELPELVELCERICVTLGLKAHAHRLHIFAAAE